MKNEIEKRELLNPREQLFCSNYCSIGTETFSHKEKSAKEAGYSESSARNVATTLLRRPDIQERISELHRQNMSRNNVTVDSVLANIAHDRQLAREKGDFSTAVRCDELEGKYLVMFTEGHLLLADTGVESPTIENSDNMSESVDEVREFKDYR